MPPRFRQLYPSTGDADLDEVYQPPTDPTRGRYVRVNMVSSVDGGTALEGTSGSLGGPADRAVFATLRAFSDVVLVGAGTMRAERYGPARLDEQHRRARLDRGQSPVPAIAVITRSSDLDWRSPFFVDADVRPIIVTVERAGDQLRQAAEVAEVVIGGADQVDLRRAVDELVARGYRNVLVEGGPTVNAELAVLDVIDELCLTVSPILLGGTSSRILRGATPDPVPHLRLGSVVTADDFLFLRYQRAEPRD